MKVLIPYLKRYWVNATVATVAVLVLVFATLWQPRLLQTVMEAIMANDKSTVWQDGLWLIALAVIGIIAGIINTVYSAKLALGVATDLRADLYQHVQKFAYADIETFSASNLVVRMTNDIQQVQGVVMATFQQVTRIPFLFLGGLILALITMPQQWWVILIMLVIIVAVAIVAFKQLSRLFGRTQQLIENVNTVARENLMGIRVVKSFVQEDNQIATFAKPSDELRDVTTRIGEVFAVLMPAFFLTANIAIAVAVYLVGQEATLHPTYIAAISSFTSYLSQILFAVINGSFMMTFATRAFISLKRINEVLDHAPSMTFAEGPEREVAGNITFDHVTFTYPGDDKPTLQDVSFTIAAGDMLGIVGATGSGKTTLAQLIPRLFDPDSGRVLIGGVDVRDLPEKTIRDAVAFVLQRSTLFSGTIADNLKQVQPEATSATMRRAAEIAQAAEFIERLPEAYNAPVEERSANFSGGQKQRLAITRGVIANPEILILDDATSALDAESEKLVQEALDRDLKHTTTVVIAEKISSIIRADQILVMDEGRVVGAGTHRELVANNTIYQEIYQTQKAKEGRLPA
ncbi:MAG: ABC transporter ATP-binding protein/permease [Lactobacillus sp.]|jgi:ATP-binding cassette subfamily B multidrug efflux pump|uniref:ABC transporter ATP-binding protein n=1 Tax=Lacticaseibacillus suilingensis TaxID=2799577 RepID=A0ABW4BE24_9LACO|nr:ABC transporter ATP-binding protein [Lacticaseibacillus suilingensis]MCI1893781.1 ABC transporter ATP-binding protein/permease [Lactobacillus sp.]MCI1918077.1 ABC transporter ATP-binding protein/permease [Lactobacillus sp.]MCI1941712.1 ABC transporter ATP-binding protein/permease [Lactobacillus sp.]MCI1972258.1 ABC transporter ATP-binding protein/permease [Lactobacillus sp.]MCI2016872.1 ABC transporter ATP-binding protein/permease [Lactobacillus sp.]